MLFINLSIYLKVETCCWEVYKQHKDKQEKLKYFKLPNFEDVEPSTSAAKDCVETDEGFTTWWTRLQPRVWKILEEPHSSKHAKVHYMLILIGTD